MGIGRLLRAILICAGLVAALVMGPVFWLAVVGPRDPAPADGIILLTAGWSQKPFETGPFGVNRARRAAELWRAGLAPEIIVTGYAPAKGGPSLARMMQWTLTDMGVRKEAIIIEERARSTFENARYATAIARARGWRRAILVTDDFHILRAWTLFRYFGAPSLTLAPSSSFTVRVPRRTLYGDWLRELAAWPYNIGKMIGWSVLRVSGASAEEAERRLY